MLVDYHVHAMGHQDYPHTPEILVRFLATAVERGIEEIGFADHDTYLSMADFDAIHGMRPRFPQLRIRIGVEADYFPDQEKEIAKKLSAYRFDYIIGSIHHIGDWMFDHPDYQAEYKNWDIDELYKTYFGLVQGMVKSGLYDLVGHLDLIKIFGYRPSGSVEKIIDAVLKTIRHSKMAVEINTNGFYKPVGEMYPSREIVEKCFTYDIPITFSSDAHTPENVGRDIAKVADIAKQVGYRKIVTFAQRKQVMMNL